jgi:hypothetical protein
MAATERITMTMRELDRYKVIQSVADGMLKPWRAAERLGLTTRQIRRLAARLREDGPGGLISRQRGKPSHNRLPQGLAGRALRLIRERYADFGPTLACEKLLECHGLQLSLIIQQESAANRHRYGHLFVRCIGIIENLPLSGDHDHSETDSDDTTVREAEVREDDLTEVDRSKEGGHG